LIIASTPAFNEERPMGGVVVRAMKYVDKTFRCCGDKRMCRLYWRRTASERINSRARALKTIQTHFNKATSP